MGTALSRLSLFSTFAPQQYHLSSPPRPHNTDSTTQRHSSTPECMPPPTSKIPSDKISDLIPAESLPLPIPPPPVAPQVHEAETTLFQLLASITYRKYFVTLPSGVRLNTLTIGPSGAPTLVLLHGWGAGVAFFAKNILPLSRSMRLHLIDWPGFGASDRPAFNPKWSPSTAEHFFVDAFLSWVSVMPKYDPSFPPTFHIVAHSLGAYLATIIAIRAPHLVHNIILASPVGLPPPPPKKIPQSAGLLVRIAFRALFAFWDAGFTPQMFIRLLGSRLGRRLARNIILPRLVIPNVSTQQALAEYFYQISNAPPSAELTLSTILESGAYARNPLCHRLPQVTVPVTFLYGERDWMSKSPAHDACLQMSVPTQIVIVPNAGHHLYFDNPDFFNTTVLNACAQYTPSTSLDGCVSAND